MGRVATAFTGEALLAGGLDNSPTFAAEKPETSVGASIDPTAPDAGLGARPPLRSSRNVEATSSADVEEAIDEDEDKPINKFCSENPVRLLLAWPA